MYWVVHPRRPKRFPRTERCPKGEVRGTSRGPRKILRSKGMCNPIQAVYGHSLIINPYLGMCQEIHPCGAVCIGGVKINTSLLMMREWVVHPRRPLDFPRPERCPEGHLEGRGKSKGLRGCATQYIPTRGSVRPFSHN